MNGVVSSNIYRQKDAPKYRLGHGVVLAYLVLWLFFGSIVTTVALRAENKKRQSGVRDVWVEGKTDSEVDLLGDQRYVLFCYLEVLTSTDDSKTRLHLRRLIEILNVGKPKLWNCSVRYSSLISF